MKRKLDEDAETKSAKFSIQRQNSSIHKPLEHGTTEIFRALRLARGFERQKLGRRQKEARGKKDVLSRLDGEINTLKSLDLSQLARYHLYKTLLRIKSIASAPDFPPYVAKKIEESKQYRDAAYLNVSARLFRSTPVLTAVEDAIKSIFQALGVKQGPNSKKRVRKADVEHKAIDMPEKQPSEEGSTTAAEPTQQDRTDSEGTSSSDDHVEAMLEVNAEASPSTIPEGGSSADVMIRSRSSTLLLEDDLESDVPLEKAQKTRPPNPAIAKTVFLPSLAAGYFSGSNSDDSEVEDINGSRHRKNRMGQQARRALAEKKFGSRAKHVQSAHQSRDHGWDARKGAQGESRERFRDNHGPGGRSTLRGRGNRDATAKGDYQGADRSDNRKDQASEGPLHPSWEAAKRRKEQKSMPTFQGKKLTFD